MGPNFENNLSENWGGHYHYRSAITYFRVWDVSKITYWIHHIHTIFLIFMSTPLHCNVWDFSLQWMCQTKIFLHHSGWKKWNLIEKVQWWQIGWEQLRGISSDASTPRLWQTLISTLSIIIVQFLLLENIYGRIIMWFTGCPTPTAPLFLRV